LEITRAAARSGEDLPQQREMPERAAAIFRYCPSDGVFFFWTMTAIQTVRENKNPVWKGNCPPHFTKAETKTELPKTHPPGGNVHKRVAAIT